MTRTIALLLALASPASADRIIRHDLGGSVDAYAAAVRAEVHPVQITGECVSACTLWLGAADACVTPDAMLGFHGPSTASGLPLTRAEFDRVTGLMATFYPPAISTWFMRDARRFTGDAILFVSGAEMIKHGVKRCL